MVDLILSPVGLWLGIILGFAIFALISFISDERAGNYDAALAVMDIGPVVILLLIAFGAWPAFHFAGMETAAEIGQVVFFVTGGALALGAFFAFFIRDAADPWR